MPKQSGKSGLAGKFGKHFNSAKTNEVDYGSSGELPAGIEMGVAQLVDCEFGVYKDGTQMAGESYFRAAGIVQSPEEHNGVKVKGLRTQIMEPIMDTPTRSRKTIADHVAWVINELKKLGVETDDIDFEEDGMIEAVAKSLAESKPFFRFRTWKGKPATEGPYAGQEPRTQHEWKGVTEFTEAGDDGVVDESEPAPKATPKSAPKAAPKKAAPEPEPEPESEEGEEGGEIDLDALVELAKNEDVEAAEKLHELAMEAGVSQEDFDGADWDEVAGLIRLGNQAEGEAEEDAEEEEWVPEVEGIYTFKPIDPKTKKPGKSVECEVIAVQKAAKTVHVQNNDTKKMYADPKTKKPIPVKWDDLGQA